MNKILGYINDFLLIPQNEEHEFLGWDILKTLTFESNGSKPIESLICFIY